MAIKIPQGFNITVQEAVDKRIVLTKDEMKAVKAARMPENYFCVCRDDGKLYIWNSTFEATEDLNKFRPYEEVINIAESINNALADESTKAAMGTSIANSIAEAFNNTTDPTAAEKITTAMFNSDQFTTNINNKVCINLDQIDGNLEE